MTDELTTVDEGPDPRDERIAELETQVLLLQAQVDQARPALVYTAIAEAGYDPESQQGRILTALADTPDFRLTSEHISARADELGFEPSSQTPAADRPSEFEVPPGKVKGQGLAQKNRELAAVMFAPLVAESE